MKSWIFLVVLVVGITAVVTVAVPFLAVDPSVAGPGIPAPTAAPEGPVPVAEVESDLTYKFGVMAQETEGKHGWIFKNTGLGALELRNLGTDCSCTIAELGKAGGNSQGTMLAVKPGASEPIELTWNTRKIDGAYRKNARIGTNDPKRPEITLAVEGEVYPAISLYPPDSAIDFLTVSNDEDHVRNFAVYSKDRPDLKLTRLVCSNPTLLGIDSRALSAEECKALNIAKGHSLEVRLQKSTNLGAFAEEILVETDHPLRPKLSLKVRGKVTGPIMTIPERVVLREVNSSLGASQDVTLWVRGRSSANFTVAKKPEGIDVAIEPMKAVAVGKGSKYKLTVKVIPGTPAGEIVAEIVLKTDVPMAGEIRLPIDILVQSSN